MDRDGIDERQLVRLKGLVRPCDFWMTAPEWGAIESHVPATNGMIAIGDTTNIESARPDLLFRSGEGFRVAPIPHFREYYF